MKTRILLIRAKIATSSLAEALNRTSVLTLSPALSENELSFSRTSDTSQRLAGCSVNEPDAQWAIDTTLRRIESNNAGIARQPHDE